MRLSIARRWRVPFKEALSDLSGYGRAQAETVRGKIVTRLGETPVVYLGHGEMGVAYGLPSGKVLKLTIDKTEVEAMAAMRKASHPNLVQVFDAFFAMDDPGSLSPLGVGAIVRESVDMTLLEVPEAGIIRLALFAALSKNRGRDRCKDMDAFAAHLAVVDGEITSVERLVLGGIREGIIELRALGVCSADFGPGNIGLIAGRPVLFDVGLAEVKDAKVDVL